MYTFFLIFQKPRQVFAKETVALKPVTTFKSQIDATTAIVTKETSSICGALIGALIIVIILFVMYLTAPLEKMLRNAKKIVKMSSEEEENKNYGPIVEKASQDIHRSGKHNFENPISSYHLITIKLCLLL